ETRYDSPPGASTPRDTAARPPANGQKPLVSLTSTVLELPQQPHLRKPPVPHDGIGRDVQGRRRFLNAQAAEKPHLDHLTLPRINLRQRVQRIVERHEILLGLCCHYQRLIERHPLRATTSLLVIPRSSRVDEHAPHRARSHGKKVRAILPLNLVDVDQPKVSLVYERSRLECVTRSLVLHVPTRQTAQLVVHERQQLVEGRLVSLGPRLKQHGGGG